MLNNTLKIHKELRAETCDDAIVTIQDFGNLGNRLQNYAVSHVLFSLQHKAVSIRTEMPFSWEIILKRKIRYLLSITFPEILLHYKAEAVRYNKFERFTKKYIPNFVYHTTTLKPPDCIKSDFDYFIVGSDQVWNPTFWGTNEQFTANFHNFLLTFAPPQKRISYAASFGISTLPEYCIPLFARELKQFKAISVREESGARIVKELTGRTPEVLIDPTMMLDAKSWRKISKKSRISKRRSTPYILTYFLGVKTPEINSRIQSIAEMNHFDVYNLLDKNHPDLYIIGPSEFIDLIDNASLICTDSFHAMAFSILFQKPFLVTNRIEAGVADMSSRITTLLKELHLERKLPGRFTDKTIFECDYQEAFDYLKKERKKAYMFLEEAFK